MSAPAGYFTVKAYLRIVPLWLDGEVTGAKVAGVTQNKPKEGHSVLIQLQVPMIAFEPMVSPMLVLPAHMNLVEVEAEVDE